MKLLILHWCALVMLSMYQTIFLGDEFTIRICILLSASLRFSRFMPDVNRTFAQFTGHAREGNNLQIAREYLDVKDILSGKITCSLERCT